MGLSVAYGIVTRHGGRIDVWSRPGEGSRFVINLPVARRTRQPVALAPGVTASSAGILVIDDDEGARRVVAEMLARGGHRVDMAGSGREGLALVRQKVYDIAVVDLGMPDMSGRQVAQAIKEVSPATPVLMITGWGLQLDEDGLRESGVDGIMAKPFSRQELLGRVAKLLARPVEQGATESSPAED